MHGKLSAITESAPQTIATATLRLDTPGPGLIDITDRAATFLAQWFGGGLVTRISG